jgi:hypothetical protein
MSDYHEGRMSFDAIADAEAAIIKDLDESGEIYCINCFRTEFACECDHRELYMGGKPLEPRHCVKCDKSEHACRCAFPNLISEDE